MGLRTVDRPAECERFARAYLVERDPIQAYLRVHPRAQLGTACIEGPRLLARPEVRAMLARGEEMKPGEETIDVVARMRSVTARLACRHCHGAGHRYQRTAQEIDQDRQRHEALKRTHAAAFSHAGKEMPRREFDQAGGDGFDAQRDPHSACPNCFGYGLGRSQVGAAATPGEPAARRARAR
jgi:phage terminase small subunit